MKRFLIVIGTRPEAIKMAPVILQLRSFPHADVRVCVTGQHQEMLRSALAVFSLTPDEDLQVMRPEQGLAELTSKVMLGVTEVITKWQPDLVLVHGDTTTAMAAAMACFYAKVALAHVEAGLRTHDLSQPWPEEANRRICDLLASLHFAPTDRGRRNLLEEHVHDASIEVTGNTVIDALLIVRDRLVSEMPLRAECDAALEFLNTSRRIILVTGHRRENFGEGIASICRALLRLANRSDVQVVYPVHPNPNVNEPVRRLLGGHPNIVLTPPLNYLMFVALMMRSNVILTDSGGIQEEAPSLGKPVLVLRDVTERSEAVEAGTVRLVGTNEQQIIDGVTTLLDNPEAYIAMTQVTNPYGDGKAAERIAARCMAAVCE